MGYAKPKDILWIATSWYAALRASKVGIAEWTVPVGMESDKNAAGRGLVSIVMGKPVGVA